MGRYISTGIVFQYCFSKSSIESLYKKYFENKKTFSEFKQEIISQLFPEIYDYKEDDKNLYFNLGNSVSGEDLITTMKAYYSISGIGHEESEEFEELCEILKGVTVQEAYNIAQERSSYIFYDTELGYSYAYYACPLTLEGETYYCAVHLSIVTIEA